MASKKGSGNRSFFRRCVKHVTDAYHRSGEVVFNAEKICGAALRDKRRRTGRKHG